MADPLSIASGVAGLLSFGIQVTKSLVDFYSAYKDQTLALAKITLKLENLLDGCPTPREDKAAVGCREIIEELSEVCQKFQKDTALGLKARIQLVGRRATYPFRESTLKKLEEDIGEIRENLSLALNVLQLRNQTGLEDGISEIKLLVERMNTIHISTTIRDWLKAPDATIDHNAAYEKRHTSTGQWLVNGQKFQNWLLEHNSFLWLNGFAGCGKSVLCSTAIQYIVRERQHQSSIGIGFFYFSFNDESKRDCPGMLRALLLQLSAQLKGGEKDLQDLHDLNKTGTPPVKALLDTLKKTICRFNDTYILLDALDESPRDNKREGVLDTVQTIRQWGLPTLHLLVTSRNEMDIRLSLKVPSSQDISMKNPDTDTDIQNFISYQLRNDSKLRQWKSRHEEIQEKLASKAQGVFRYVECQLLALKRARIRNHIDKCLRSLPRDLDETYERMLCSIDEQDAPEARLVLTLLCVSAQPLTVKEVIGALAIDVRKWQLDREGRSFSQDHLLDICLGLIELAVIKDEVSGQPTTIARIAHFSVQEYLESDRISQQGAARFAIQEEPAHKEIAQICLVYLLDPTLSDGEFNEAKLEVFPLASFAAMRWCRFYKYSGKGKSEIEPLILRLFKDQPESFVTWVQLHDIDRLMPPRFGGGIYNPSAQEDDFNRAVEGIPSPVYYAVLLRLEYILSALIARWGHENTIGAALNTQKSVNEKVVQTLLDHGVGVNAQGGFFGNALQAASFGFFNGGAQEEYYERAVDEKMVQTLLDHGADVNAQGGKYGNALQAASHVGRGHVVRTLLNHGADFNVKGGKFGNALQAASEAGHEEVIQILLDQGADINAEGDSIFGNALQLASRDGQVKVVQTLLDHGADINAQGGKYGNALQAASLDSQEKVVQILLDGGADINAEGGIFGNAVQASSEAGHEEVVQILLDRGADINAEGGIFGNALQAASCKGREKVVQILLHHGADVNAEGGEYGNALKAALQEGHEKVVQILLDNGAKPEPIV
ncbi:unnamed protein product [Penicillium nalgiovense]|uniref:NACHT domain-containing protein n=1 Tax=Penicillium nalgiovense TaxID=60175 RepID=A0A9W4HQW7_PENNA|nr:unnamed protein product [Penicillium nalgiovense]CAG8012685.1 unnamed protein product [Penicillium nalgiovense]CAG8036723.1 unnamed protein product [Penicillium nalgiovense]CAG8046864.1 unnamed protein product [Penicillium nalgiovense]CAG8099837.1 unnamed protein product [Penicillium nalgiovense]